VKYTRIRDAVGESHFEDANQLAMTLSYLESGPSDYSRAFTGRSWFRFGIPTSREARSES
jgi:hypothetical protein